MGVDKVVSHKKNFSPVPVNKPGYQKTVGSSQWIHYWTTCPDSPPNIRARLLLVGRYGKHSTEWCVRSSRKVTNSHVDSFQSLHVLWDKITGSDYEKDRIQEYKARLDNREGDCRVLRSYPTWNSKIDGDEFGRFEVCEVWGTRPRDEGHIFLE